MTAIRTRRRRRRSTWRGWAGSPIAQLIDEELTVIAEHNGYVPEPSSRWRRKR